MVTEVNDLTLVKKRRVEGCRKVSADVKVSKPHWKSRDEVAQKW